AKPADPRESWGKVERWTAADSERASAMAAAAAERAGVAKPPIASKSANDPLMQPEKYTTVPASKTEVTKAEPAKVEPAKAETTLKPTPLTPPVITEYKSEPKPAPARRGLFGLLRGSDEGKVVSAEPKVSGRFGMGSVAAASSARMQREMDMVMVAGPEGPMLVPREEVKGHKVIAVDVTGPNAFSGPMAVRQPEMPPAHVAMPPMMMPGGGTM